MKKILLVSVVALAGCGAGVVAENEAPTLSEAQMKGGCRVICPKCKPGQPCPMIACYIDCPKQQKDPAICGSAVCRNGDVCCNSSCGICTAPGGFCTQQVCEPPTTGGCTTDADCRTFADYCTGCDCRALGTSEPDPFCDGPGVRCFADPCLGQTAVCNVATGACELAPASI